MFFKNTKTKILELAKNAVMVAETELSTETGAKKKEMAINYVLNNLPVSELYKNIIAVFLSDFIDNAIEIAVKYLKTLQQNRENNLYAK